MQENSAAKHFARDFERLTDAWALVPEPRPIAVQGVLVFPDYALVHGHDPRRRWMLELVGFWTPEYLQAKEETLRQFEDAHVLLAVSESLGDKISGDLGEVIPFKSSLSIKNVLERLQEVKQQANETDA